MAHSAKLVGDAGPLVSVIIPAYNHAAFVGECIRSVLDQSVVDLEIIITDDGSSDETASVIRQFSDSRLHLDVFAKNRGTVTAANSAMRRARGEFICFLSSDDYFLPGKLEKQVRFLRANPGIGAVFGLPRPIDERGALIPNPSRWFTVFWLPFDEGLRSKADWLRRFYRKGNCLCYPTAMVRRSVVEEIGEFDARLANLSDFDLWVRLCAVRDIHVMREELAAMRMLDHDRNLSASRRDTRLRTAIETFLIRRRYLQLPQSLLNEIFAAEIVAHPEWDRLSNEMLLVENALLTGGPTETLFALDLMLDEAARSGDYPRLYEFTGSIDPFGLEARQEASQLRTKLRAARTGASGVSPSKNIEHRRSAEEIDRLKKRAKKLRRKTKSGLQSRQSPSGQE